MNKEKFRKYVIDIIILLKELASKEKTKASNQKERTSEYIEGALMGYYSIITLLKHEAFVFCIDQKELGLADIDPDVDLLGLAKNPHINFEEDNWSIDMISEEKIKRYLNDSITLLKEQAKEVKKEVGNLTGNLEDYNNGEYMAYYSFFSILKYRASVFEIDEKEIGINDI